MVRLALLVWLVAGCNRVFGITPITPTPDAPVTSEVTGTAGWTVIDLDPMTGVPFASQQLVRGQIAVTLASGEQPAVAFDSKSHFSFTRDDPAQAYHLTYTVALDNAPQIVDDTAGDVNLVFPLYGPVARTPITQPTWLEVKVGNVTSPGLGGLVYIASTGPRALYPIGPPDVRDVTIDWSLAGSLSGPVSALDAARHDRLWYLRYLVDMSIDAVVLSDYANKEQTVTDGIPMSAPLTVNLTATPVTPNRCLAIATDRAEEMARVDAALPDPTGADQDAWEIGMTPVRDAGYTGAIPLAFTFTPGAPAHETRMVSLELPSTDEQLLLQRIAENFHSYNLPGNTGPSATFASGTRTYIPLADDASCSALDTVPPAVAIPTRPTIGGAAPVELQPLAIDRSQPLPIAWGVASPGLDDWEAAQIFEVTLDSQNTPRMTLIATYLPDHSPALADPKLFAPGRFYAVRIVTSSGFPAAAHRDYRAIQYPVQTGYAFSPVFQAGT